MNGIELITQERKRQIEVEGWTQEHDKQHIGGDLAAAGAAYAVGAASSLVNQDDDYRATMYADVAEVVWPWDEEWWKPTPENIVRQLAKAGALIAAEIDRIQG